MRYKAALTDDKNVIGVERTVSPSFKSKEIQARCRAAVPLLTAKENLHPKNFLILSSKVFTLGPWVSQLLFKVFDTDFKSFLSI